MPPLRFQDEKHTQELRDLLNKWDPVGLIAAGAPKDEYDCLLGKMIRLLVDDSDEETIVESLSREFPEHFGVEMPKGTREQVKRIRKCFSIP